MVTSTSNVTVKLSEYPHPYRAAMAICSDLDRTADRRAYLEICRFLNTNANTSMGPGVGLEVGNSIYFEMAPGEFAYDTTDDAGRQMVRDLIASGHIDVLHSYGDLARTREAAKRNLDELNRYGCKLEVWVDHSKAPTNFGPDIMVGSGDVKESPSYHADLTLQYGIRYVWRGRTTGVNGQNVPIGMKGLTNILHLRHPIGSARTMAKEAVKIRLGRKQHPRWEMYAQNRVRRLSKLRDGQPMWEFLRSNPYWNGSGLGDTGDGIAGVLTEKHLRDLTARRGVCILYTHLGKGLDPQAPIGPAARDGFKNLARYQQSGDVFVTTTKRLLKYLTVRDCLQWRYRVEQGTTIITIDEIKDPLDGTRSPSVDDLQGMTFVCDRCENAIVRLNDGTVVPAQVMQQPNATVATVPWQRLTFPDLGAA